jgi:DnaK suppressor protein
MAATKATKAGAKKATAKATTKQAAGDAPAKKEAASSTKAAPAKTASKATTKQKEAPPEAAPSKAAATKAPAQSAAATAKAPQKAPTGKRLWSDKTPAAKRPPIKAPRTGPLDKFLQAQLEALNTERATYKRQAASLKAEADLLAAEREPGDVQFDEESGEGDTLAVERERDLALSAQASAAVDEIDLAIIKIHDGSYGICEQCGSAIPKERLRALPYAALCVECKSAGFARR